MGVKPERKYFRFYGKRTISEEEQTYQSSYITSNSGLAFENSSIFL